MKKRVLITTPIPSPEELAEQLGVSQTRLRRIQAILRDEGLMVSPKSARKDFALTARKATPNAVPTKRSG